MEAHEVTAAHLPLGEVVTAWGAEKTGDVLRRLSGVVCHVVVMGAATDRARVFRSSQVMRSDPDMLLDLLPGGREALIVESDIKAFQIPESRPLLFREDGEIIGILMDGAAPPIRKAASTGSSDARALAQRRVREAMNEFRKDAVPLLLDIRSARVRGDGAEFAAILDGLLAECLRRAKTAPGATCTHVLVTEGKSGVWLVIEDRSGALDFETQAQLVSDEPSDHPTVLALRKLQTMAEAAGGSMTAQPNPFGVRSIVCLPG
jgi:hypothetical protein